MSGALGAVRSGLPAGEAFRGTAASGTKLPQANPEQSVAARPRVVRPELGALGGLTPSGCPLRRSCAICEGVSSSSGCLLLGVQSVGLAGHRQQEVTCQHLLVLLGIPGV